MTAHTWGPSTKISRTLSPLVSSCLQGWREQGGVEGEGIAEEGARVVWR